jgi:hypothetical protein
LRYQVKTLYHISERDTDLNLDSKSHDEFAFANCYPDIIIMKSHIRKNLEIENPKIRNYSDSYFIKLKLEGVSNNTTYYNEN